MADERQPIKTEMKLPPEIQAQLDRVKELEKRNAELLKDKEDLQVKFAERGERLADSGEIPIERENGDVVYRYAIDLPPSGGISIGINGVQYYHGQAYEFTRDVLDTVKEMVFRSWEHERNIKGSDENAYRPQLAQRLSGRGLRR